MSPDFLSQDWMDVHVYGDAMVSNMHNVMLFRGAIFLWFHYGGGRGDRSSYFDSNSVIASMFIEGIFLNYLAPYMPFVGAPYLCEITCIHMRHNGCSNFRRMLKFRLAT